MRRCCEELEGHLRDGEVAIVYFAKYREYGIRVLDGGCAIQMIAYCPWCGTRLPASLRDEWFRRIDAIGVEEDGDEVPEEFKTDEWWQSES